MPHKIVALGRKTQPEDGWPASLAKSVNFQFIERLCLKNNNERGIGEDILVSILEQTHCIYTFAIQPHDIHTYAPYTHTTRVHAHTQTCTYEYTNAQAYTHTHTHTHAQAKKLKAFRYQTLTSAPKLQDS